MSFLKLTGILFLLSFTIFSSHAKDICDESNIGVGVYNFENDCSRYQVCSKEMRINILCSFRDAMLYRYAMIDLKNILLKYKNFNSKLHLQSCIEEESKINENSTIAFYERAMKCVAGFEDSHLNIVSKTSLPTVFTGFRIHEVNGKFYIGEILPKILSYSQAQLKDLSFYKWYENSEEDNPFADITLGTEVRSIDGLTPEIWISKLVPYISGSSYKARRLIATRKILERNFLYPSLPYVDVELAIGKEKDVNKQIKKIRLPWWREGGVLEEANIKLTKVGILSSDQIKYQFNNQRQQWEYEGRGDTIGYKNWSPLFNLGELAKHKVYLDEEGNEEIIFVGEFIHEGKGGCYLQLTSFLSEKVFEKGTNQEISFIDAIRNFIKQCSNDRLPLILDLRDNSGGWPKLVKAMFSMVTPKEKKYPSSVGLFRKTDYTYRLVSSMDISIGNLMVRYLDSDEDKRILKEAFSLNDPNQDNPYTSMLVSRFIQIDPEVINKRGEDYKEKIVVAMTPHCISACDEMVYFFINSKRPNTVLIGGPSNGTGAGYAAFDNSRHTWTDIYDLFKVNIPFLMFGVYDQTEEPETRLISYNENLDLITENKPALPDIEYAESLEDILNDGAGWRAKLLEELFK